MRAGTSWSSRSRQLNGADAWDGGHHIAGTLLPPKPHPELSPQLHPERRFQGGLKVCELFGGRLSGIGGQFFSGPQEAAEGEPAGAEDAGAEGVEHTCDILILAPGEAPKPE